MPIYINYNQKYYNQKYYNQKYYNQKYYNGDIKYNSFEEIFSKINNYDEIVYIDCYNNQLTSLPKLPNSLQELYCDNNKLTSLPKLLNSLQELDCSNNQLTELPELPKSLQILYYVGNKFIKTHKYKYLHKFY